MSWKRKPDKSKRVNRPLACDFTKAFKKDWERMPRSGRFNMAQIRRPCCC